MKRSRDYVEQSCLKEVYVPFRKFIPAGHSLFTVDVPQAYAEREFFFSYVVLVPDFYSQQAAEMNLDPDIELNQPVNYSLYYKISLDSDHPLYPESVTIPQTVKVPYTLALTVNDFFETKKPTGTNYLGMFIDWYDIRFDDLENITWDEYVRTIVANQYYNMDFDEKLHFNQLPPSARTVPGANNYLFPTSTSAELYTHLRWRINLAPKVDGLFSTPTQLLKMGFTEEQLGGKRRYKQKYMLDNDSKMNFKKIMAQNKPSVLFSEGYQLIVSCKSNSLTFTTHPINFSVTKEKSLKNINYQTTIKKALQDYALQCNFSTGFHYNETEKTFTFDFPNNPVLNNLVINLPLELSERLGFHFVQDITKTSATGQKVDDDIDVKESETRARALAYDTSLVVISHTNSSANTTAGINYAYMAALYPTGFGTLEISPVEACLKPPTLKLPITLYGTPSSVPATFKLSRFLDNSELTNLVWTTGAYIFGVLRGVEP